MLDLKKCNLPKGKAKQFRLHIWLSAIWPFGKLMFTDWYHSHICLKMQLARLCRKATSTSEDVTRLKSKCTNYTIRHFSRGCVTDLAALLLAGTSWQANSEAFGMFVQVGHGLTWCGKLVSKQFLIWISISCEVALSSGALFLPNWWV